MSNSLAAPACKGARTRVNNCPKCGTELRQLGHMELHQWIPENLFNCSECKYPGEVKIYSLQGTMLRPAAGNDVRMYRDGVPD